MDALQKAAAEAIKHLYYPHKGHAIKHKSEGAKEHFERDFGMLFRVSLAGALYTGHELQTSESVMMLNNCVLDCIRRLTIDRGVSQTYYDLIISFSNNEIDIVTNGSVMLNGVKKVKALNPNKQLEFCLRMIMEEGKTDFTGLAFGTYSKPWHKEFFKS